MFSTEDLEALPSGFNDDFYGSFNASTANTSSSKKDNGKLPRINSILKGTVMNVKHFGAFICLEGYPRWGLVHKSQLASYDFEKIEDIISKGDDVFVKVMDIKDQDSEKRINLSMKYVSQSDGVDRDPNNAKYEMELTRKRPIPKEPEKLRLEAILNTTCAKCGGSGHVAFECYNINGQVYEFLSEPEDDLQIKYQEEQKKNINNTEGNGNHITESKKRRDRSKEANDEEDSNKKRRKKEEKKKRKADEDKDRKKKHKHKHKHKK